LNKFKCESVLQIKNISANYLE